MRNYVALVSLVLSLALMTSSATAAYRVGTAWPGGIVPYKVISDPSCSGVNPNALCQPALDSLDIAVDYYNNNTQIQLIDVTNDPSYTNRSDYLLISRQTSPTGNSFATYGVCAFACPAPYMLLTDNASPFTVSHEFFHALGFAHEHSRPDRGSHISIDPDSVGDYGVEDILLWYENYVGSFDHNSISHYFNYTMILESDPAKVIELAKFPASFHRTFRILHGTEANLFDKDAVSNENSLGNSTAPLTVGSFEDGWHSAKFDFEYTGTGDQFRIYHWWSDKYLYVNGSNIAFGTLATVTSLGNAGKWNLIASGGGIQIKNAGTNQYLYMSGTDVVLDSSLSTAWLIRAAKLREYDEKLSMMDTVALHNEYGWYHRIREVDSTPSDPNDNDAIHIEYGSPEVSPGSSQNPGGTPLAQWASAMWRFEWVRYGNTKTEYVRIKNLWTQEYLHVENGFPEMDPSTETNGYGDALPTWWSAMWILEIKGDHFLIRNRSQSTKYLDNDSGTLMISTSPSKWLMQVVP